MGAELDAVNEVIDAANARWGRRLRLLHRFPRGGEGVYAVEDVGERKRYALRFWPSPATIDSVFAEIYRRLDHIRAQGVPVPRTVTAGHVGSAFVELAEWVDGEAPRASDDRLVEGALAILRSMRQCALGDGTQWGPWLLTSIDDDAVNFFRPAKLRAAGGEGASILSAAQAVMGRFVPDDLVARDIVHGDFGLGNILAQDGTIAAVVDWSGCRDGSGCFDATALWWDLAETDAGPAALVRVRREVDSYEPADRATCAAHYAARHAAAALGKDRQDAVFKRAWSELAAAATCRQ